MKKNILLFLALAFCLTKSEPIALISIPKAGTHMLMKLVRQLTNTKLSFNISWLYPEEKTVQSVAKNSSFYYLTHAICIPEHIQLFENFKTVFIYRDPRDQLISLAYYMKKDKKWPCHTLSLSLLISRLINDYSLYYTHNVDGLAEQVLLDLKGVDTFYNLYIPWMEQKNVFAVKFEDLVGNRGGGSDELQLSTITKMASFFNLNLSSSRIKSISQNLFGPSGESSNTFRSGTIGAWKKHFTEEQKQLFKNIAGQLLIQLGYEKDFAW